MDALELLRSDHDTVRDLFERFRSAQDSQDTAQMAQLKEEIFQELRTHTAIEEDVFYPAAKEVGQEAEELVSEGVEEHHVVKVLMGEVDELDPAEDTWVAKMTVLIENVEHHAKEEEQELFPQLGETFGDDRLADMGERLAQAKQRHHGGADATSASKQELYERAKEQDVPGRSRMSKDELADAVDED